MDKLEQDAIAARESGMSYGQWKALQPNTPILVEGVNGVIRCGFCGNLFNGNRTRKYCSPECAYAARLRCANERNRRKREENGN